MISMCSEKMKVETEGIWGYNIVCIYICVYMIVYIRFHQCVNVCLEYFSFSNNSRNLLHNILCEMNVPRTCLSNIQ